MKKRLAVLSTVVMSVGVAAAAMASTIKYEYDRDVNFSKWTSVAWRVPARAEASITERRIIKAIEAGFAGRGYVLVGERTRAETAKAVEKLLKKFPARGGAQ